jgi:cytochrome c oxidase cbb3-type subunit III
VTDLSKQKPAFGPKTGEGRPPFPARICLLVCTAGLCALLAVPVAHPRAPLPAQTQGPSASQLEMGRQTFTSGCAGCHGLDGRGGPRAPNIATRAEVRRLTNQQIFHVIHDGSASRAMPAFGTTLNAVEIRALVQYLRLLQGARGAAALPGDPQEGKSLFFSQAGCGSCHIVQGQGGFIAGDLTDYAATKSPGEIRAAITSPDGSSDSHQRLATATTRTGQTFTGLVRNEDNFSIQLQSLDGSFHLLDRSEIESITFDRKPLMPSDYSTKLSSQQIDAIVGFLMWTAFAALPAASPSHSPMGANRTRLNE